MLAIALALVIGAVFYSRLPQSGTSETDQVASTRDATPANCTLSDAATRVMVGGPGAAGICLRLRDLYNLEVNAASTQAADSLNPRCSYRDAAGDLITVDVSGTAASDSAPASAICHDLATDRSWQVVQ